MFPHLAQKITAELITFCAENNAELVSWHLSVEEHKSMTPVRGFVLSRSDHKYALEYHIHTPLILRFALLMIYGVNMCFTRLISSMLLVFLQIKNIGKLPFFEPIACRF